MSEVKGVLYLIVKRPDPKFQHKWRGSELLAFHTHEKVKNTIEKYRSERMFVKITTGRDVVCSVMVEEVTKNEDGSYLVKFNDIRRDNWVLPGEIRGTAAGGFVVGRPPIPIPMN